MADLIDRATTRKTVRDVMAAMEWPPTDGDAQIDAVLDAIAALPAQGVRVKPLEWRDAKISDKWQRWTSDTLFGQYEVLEYSDGGFGWNVSFHDADIEALQYSAEGIDAAKAAAQADYERRILAALEPAEQPVATSEAGGVEAIKDALASLDMAQDKLNAALGASEGHVTPAPDAVEALVKAAVEAERERCAEIARKAWRDGYDAAPHIAAIREGRG